VKRIFYRSNDDIYIDFKALIVVSKEMGMDITESLETGFCFKNSKEFGTILVPIGR